jgi:hypothetical protein
LKLLSVSPEYEDAAIEGICRILGVRQGEGMPEERIKGIRFGMSGPCLNFFRPIRQE